MNQRQGFPEMLLVLCGVQRFIVGAVRWSLSIDPFDGIPVFLQYHFAFQA